MKFGRNYRLTISSPVVAGGSVQSRGAPAENVTPVITGSADALSIQFPITMQFNIQKNTYGGFNTATIALLNLSEQTRAAIFKDRWNNFVQKSIVLEAGYDTLYTVFKGNIFEANSARQGVDIVTTIVSKDGYLAATDTQINQTFAKGVTIRDLAKSMIGTMPDTTVGAIGGDDYTFKRPIAVTGNTFDNLQKYTQNHVFVDDGAVHILNDNQVIKGEAFVINADSGLLETPKRDDAYMTVSMLFEPRIRVGGLVRLESSILTQYNGEYKVVGVSHSGTISGAVGGDCRTVLNLVNGQYFKGFEAVGTN